MGSAAVPVAPERGAATIIAEGRPMRQALEMARRVATTTATVLVRGESGTGKELLATLIPQRSPRAAGPFVVVNCAAIPEPLLESELFGHEKGAFAGAVRQRAGRFERASGGTLFLDEIGDMGMGVQAKILRALEVGEIERVGGDRPLPVDVRLIAATRRDLEAQMRAGQFRQDLYYRLAVVVIALPPLRERTDEVAPLARHFLEQTARTLTLREIESRHIAHVLALTGGNRVRAARLLGIHRNTLRRRMQEYGISGSGRGT